MPDTLEINHSYVPLPKQEIAHRSRKRYLLFGGAVGPGKTRFIVEHAHATMWRWPGVHLLMARQNRKDLARTTETQWQRFVDNRLWDRRYGGSYDGKLDAYIFPNGSTLFMGGLKTHKDWMSAEFAKNYLEECDEIPEETLRDLDTRLRWTTGAGVCELPECAALATAREHPIHPIYQNIMICNPNPRWPKTRFFDRMKAGTLPPDHEFVQALTSDNPSLPPDYLESLAANNNPLWVRRMLEGDWTAFEGATFPMFTRATHTVPEDWYWQNEAEEIWGAIDWGATTTYAHRTVALVLARMRDGSILVVWEYSKQGPASVDFWPELERANKVFRVRSWVAPRDQSRTFDLAKDRGIKLIPAHQEKGSRQDGITLLANLFAIQADGEPKLKIRQDCTHTITGIEAYHEVPQSEAMTGYGPVTEDPVRRDDDEVDALRYGVTALHRMKPIVTERSLEVISGASAGNARISSILATRRQIREARMEKLLKGWGER